MVCEGTLRRRQKIFTPFTVIVVLAGGFSYMNPYYMNPTREHLMFQLYEKESPFTRRRT